MSTTTLSSLLEYLYGTLTPSNMRWMAAHLTEYAERMENSQKPYTMEEINAMIDAAERDIAAGKGTPSEDLWSEMEEEMSREEAEEAAFAQRHSNIEESQLELA